MTQRFVALWFRHLKTDWLAIRYPALRVQPLVLTSPIHGRMVITAVNRQAREAGLLPGMVLADARAQVPGLKDLDDSTASAGDILHKIALWAIRYTPTAAIDGEDGLLLDATGCVHLWGGEQNYLDAISRQLSAFGYELSAAIADTVGAAWAVARYGKERIVAYSQQLAALSPLPPAALRLSAPTIEKLHKLGLHTIGTFIHMSRSSLQRRFGLLLLERLDQATGTTQETIQGVQPPIPYRERLPCLEPILTRVGIEIALDTLLTALCARLQQEAKGLREARLLAYRSDGHLEQARIATLHPSQHKARLQQLFHLQIGSMAPGPGIELFVLEAYGVEACAPVQEALWRGGQSIMAPAVAELIDRIALKTGKAAIRRFLPQEHYWPELSLKASYDLKEQSSAAWPHQLRPILLLERPMPVQVAAPIPDYPPMLFRLNGQVHRIRAADGPERIESVWWLAEGEYRDYFIVEDEQGGRYWLFRAGYHPEQQRWYLHGFFA